MAACRTDVSWVKGLNEKSIERYSHTNLSQVLFLLPDAQQIGFWTKDSNICLGECPSARWPCLFIICECMDIRSNHLLLQ